jgi:hypothetical protein
VLAVSPATVSFPIAVAVAVTLVCGLAATLGVNLALLRGLAQPATGERSRRSNTSVPPTRSAGAVRRATIDQVEARRLLVCWTTDHDPSDGGAEGWATEDLRRVLAAERISAARLSRLRPASLRYRTTGDWLLELDVMPGRQAQNWLESSPWTEWLGDLRSLGMCPSAMVAEHGRVLRARVK